jgi:hypothetical protein
MRNALAVLIFATLFSTFTLLFPSYSKSEASVTISGKITNIQYLLQYIDKDTVLQLIKLPKSGFATDQDDRHRFYYKSNLAKIQFPKAGVFTFSANLGPGKYFLSGQFFTNGRVNPMLMKGEHPATVYVKDNAPQDINFGEVFFQY